LRQIPAFDQAVEEFREVLASRGHPREVSWIFREDFYAPGVKRFVVVDPRPDENRVLAETYYERARATGSVLLRGMFQAGEATAAAVWTPTEVSDKAPPGLKLTVADPFPEAKRVKAGLSWWLHQMTPAYRYNLKRSFDVPLRSVVARNSRGPEDPRYRGQDG
jgi:hypothetical protein